MIDIVDTTCDRLTYLRKTLEYIVERTTTPYRLIVVDDASTGGTVEFLQEMVAKGVVETLVTRQARIGPEGYLQNLLNLTTSDPIVVTDDDVLCPKLKPDWLAQGLEVLEQHQELGVLALNNPACNVRRSRKVRTRGPQVTTCTVLGGTFLFIRRRALEGYIPPIFSRLGPIKTWLRSVAEPRGYLTNVYCQHIGMKLVRTRDDLSKVYQVALPLDGDTLEPQKQYRG